MALALGFRMLGLARLVRSMDGAGPRLVAGMEQKMRVAVEELVGRAKIHIRGSRATNPPELLGVVSGRLRGSIVGTVERRGKEIVGRVGTNVVYAATHEFGERSRGIRPRPYLGPAVEEMRERVRELLGQAFTGSVLLR